jgi:hypothetical protein
MLRPDFPISEGFRHQNIRDICLGDSKYSVSLFGKYIRSMVIVLKKYIVDQHYMICAFGFLSRKFRINQDVLP